MGLRQNMQALLDGKTLVDGIVRLRLDGDHLVRWGPGAKKWVPDRDFTVLADDGWHIAKEPEYRWQNCYDSVASAMYRSREEADRYAGTDRTTVMRYEIIDGKPRNPVFEEV